MSVVLLAGGGTAGHVNPLLATAEKLKKAGHIVHVLGACQGLENDLVPAAGYPLHTIEKVAMPRRLSLQLFSLPFRLTSTVKKVRNLLHELRVDVVVGFGGYVSTPAYLAARQAKIPVVIHEQNARPGMANKLGARWATDVALTFDSTPLKALRGRTHMIGLPLREQIENLVQERLLDSVASRQRCAQKFDLNPDKPILLITGGSLGAQHINEVMCRVMATTNSIMEEGTVDTRCAVSTKKFPKDTQIIHLTGRGKDKDVRKAVMQTGMTRYRVLDYLSDMESALGCCDLVICRSGAGAVAEMTALGIPAVYVPLPFGNGEQALNAHDVVSVGGSLMVANDDFSVDTVLDKVIPLLHDKETLELMSVKAQQCGRTTATEVLSNIVMERIQNQ